LDKSLAEKLELKWVVRNSLEEPRMDDERK